MKNLIRILMLSSLFSLTAMAEEGDEVRQAIAWLELIDNGDYAASWDQAAPYFQRAISSSQWQEALSKVREPLGQLVKRELNESTYHDSLAGAPDGDYYVITLNTEFADKQSAVETITVIKVDEQWRAVGYFIK